MVAISFDNPLHEQSTVGVDSSDTQSVTSSIVEWAQGTSTSDGNSRFASVQTQRAGAVSRYRLQTNEEVLSDSEKQEDQPLETVENASNMVKEFTCCCWQGHDIRNRKFEHFSRVDKEEYVNTCPIDGPVTSLCYHVIVIDPTFQIAVRSSNTGTRAVETLLNEMITTINGFGPHSDAHVLQKMLIQFIEKESATRVSVII